MSYQQCTSFRTTLDFDRHYLSNGSSNRQAENDVSNYDFFHVRWKQFGKLWSINKNDPKFCPVTLNVNRGCRDNIHAKFDQADCSGSWVIVSKNCFALSRNGKESENPVLWPWSLTCDLENQKDSCRCQDIYRFLQNFINQSIKQVYCSEPCHTHTINLTNKNKREKVTHEHL